MTDTDREAILAANDDYARQGLRVLAVAYRNLEEVADLPKPCLTIVQKSLKRIWFSRFSGYGRSSA